MPPDGPPGPGLDERERPRRRGSHSTLASTCCTRSSRVRPIACSIARALGRRTLFRPSPPSADGARWDASGMQGGQLGETRRITCTRGSLPALCCRARWAAGRLWTEPNGVGYGPANMMDMCSIRSSSVGPIASTMGSLKCLLPRRLGAPPVGASGVVCASGGKSRGGLSADRPASFILAAQRGWFFAIAPVLKLPPTDLLHVPTAPSPGPLDVCMCMPTSSLDEAAACSAGPGTLCTWHVHSTGVACDDSSRGVCD